MLSALSPIRRLAVVLLGVGLAVGAGCGGHGGTSSGSSSTSGAESQITLTIAPASVTIEVGGKQAFATTVTGTSAREVTWYVNGIAGGREDIGTIDASGVYSAPAPEFPASVLVIAVSNADHRTTAVSQVSLINPIPSITAVSPQAIKLGNFSLSISGTKFMSGATVNFNGRTLSTTFVSPSQVTASGVVAIADAGNATITVTNPGPGESRSKAFPMTVNTSGPSGVTYDAAVRFLEQSTFGPTESLVAHVQDVGFEAFLNEQFNSAVSQYPAAPSNLPVQQQFFKNAITGNDQLRQRVAFALEQIVVISGSKIQDSSGTVSWLRMMQTDALGNFHTLMKDVTLHPAMGRYLDMVNNDNPQDGSGIHSNENYARELMQLFTIGLYQVNTDGTPKLDGGGRPITTYDQNVIHGLAQVLTGWTYPTQPDATLQSHNPEYYGGPMELVESNHDPGAKVLLNGFTVPAGQGGSKDLEDALTNIFNHPNVGPFICRRLIQHLVKSNPSAAYLQRVATVFNDNGNGVRGDLKAVVRAILLDEEARVGDSSPTSQTDGHLREPVLYATSVMRALNGTSDGLSLISQTIGMEQNILFPPSVFNYFHATYEVPGANLLGPEFEIFTPTTVMTRANFINSLVFGALENTTVDLSSWTQLASTPDRLLNKLDHFFLHGRMSSKMRSTILHAMETTSDDSTKAKQALYLVTTAPDYMVEQ